MRDFMKHYLPATDDRYRQGTSRRDFIKLITGASAGLTLGVHLPTLAEGNKQTAGSAFAPNAFVRIAPDDSITVIIKHLDMGQGVSTGLATIAAEELDADWNNVATESAPANANLYNNLLFGPVQGTGGSTAIANSYMQMRLAGAKARAMLVNAAAKVWQVKADEIQTRNSTLSHASGKTASYGEMAELAALQPVPDDDAITLKSPDQFTLIGKTGLARKDMGKSNGTATFTLDVQLEGMATALVAHPPAFGATVKHFDASDAKNVSGVIDVVQIPTGVAVIADSFWTAKTARDKLRIEWDRTAFTKDTDTLKAEYLALAEKPGLPARNDGDADKALSAAKKTIEATYSFPFLAHAPMEPMNCVVLTDGKKAELWYGAQLQTIDQMSVAAVLDIKPENVSINTLFAGGSFGRRANSHSDYVVEATHIAKTQPGVPIKLVWTREDDMRAGYYRPMYIHKLRGGVDENGNITAWEQRIVGQSIATGTAFEAFMVKDGIDASSVEGAANLPYAIPNLSVQLHTVDLPVPVLWWRSVGHTHTAFSTETFIDELAALAGKDPVEVRRELLKDHPRHLAVLNLAAEKANWGSPLPIGKGRGIAVHESFRSYVAQVAEVTVSDGKVTVDKVICAVDCGVAINPDVIKTQMQGGIGFGLSPALLSEITLTEGAAVQSNFHDYLVLREPQMPEVDVYILPSAEAPTGVGEPGVPPIAPAVANAIFSITGQRVYDLPMKLT